MGMSKSRGYQPKKRGQIKRERRSVIVLSTEGKNETETNYFKEFGKAKNRVIRFAPGNYTDPINMIKSLEKE